MWTKLLHSAGIFCIFSRIWKESTMKAANITVLIRSCNQGGLQPSFLSNFQHYFNLVFSMVKLLCHSFIYIFQIPITKNIVILQTKWLGEHKILLSFKLHLLTKKKNLLVRLWLLWCTARSLHLHLCLSLVFLWFDKRVKLLGLMIICQTIVCNENYISISIRFVCLFVC